MYVGRDFDPSDTGEDEIYTLDFARDLALGENLVEATWSCAAVEGTDAGAAAHLAGGATVAGTKTLQRVNGLLPGVKYRLQAFVVTDQGNKRSLWSHVSVKDPT